MAAFTEIRPHVVVIPFPAQGHYNHHRLTRSRGPGWATAGLDGFRFETIPDGLPPPSDENSTQDVPALCASTRATCLAPFRDLMPRLRRAADVPPVTGIVSDGAMGFTVDEDFGVPVLLFFTHSACGCWSYCHIGELVRRGYTPLKDESFLTNGYLDTPIDAPHAAGIILNTFDDLDGPMLDGIDPL
ncbi:hypothetical protein GW17_00004858 [Ensete ventricosum]|nr:hypothetical protein GW17_00004858 [Ensete ventricosum]